MPSYTQEHKSPLFNNNYKNLLEYLIFSNEKINSLTENTSVDKKIIDDFSDKYDNVHCVNIIPYYVLKNIKYYILREEILYNKKNNIYSMVCNNTLGMFGGKREISDGKKESIFLTAIRELYEESCGILRVSTDDLLKSPYYCISVKESNGKTYYFLIFIVEINNNCNYYDIMFNEIFNSELYLYIRKNMDHENLKQFKLYSYYATNSLKIINENNLKNKCYKYGYLFAKIANLLKII